LDVFATYAPTGLSGNSLHCPSQTFLSSSVPRLCQPGGISPALLVSGFSQSLTQIFHSNFPDYSFGVTLQIPIRNRSAQADMATALLQERQLRTQLQQTKNQVDQQVRNAVIAVTQAKAQINAAHKAVILAQQTLDAEQKKFQLGESTVFLVIQAERDLVTAQGNEVLAHSNYSKALTQFWQATGSTLEKYNIELAEAKTGQMARAPNIPGTPVSP
jgi:outer membrane protein TolC